MDFESFYSIREPNNRIQEYIFNHKADYDTILISQEKDHLKAHRIVLALSSGFFRDLFDSIETVSNETIYLQLPDYKTETISTLLSIFYTGQATLISKNQIDTFHELCNCLKFSSEIDILICGANSSTVTEYQEVDVDQPYIKQESENVTYEVIEIGKLTDDEEIILTEEEDDDETLFQQVIEEEIPTKMRKITQPDCSTKISYRSGDGNGLNPIYEKNLMKACKDILENKCSYLSTSKKYGIARSVIHRHVHRLKNERENDKLKGNSWWENHKSNTSCNVEMDKICQDNNYNYKIPSPQQSRAKDPEFLEKVKKAVACVLNDGNSYWTAQKKYGITRSVIYRYVQKAKGNNSSKSSQKSIQKVKSTSTIPSNTMCAAPNVNVLQNEFEDFKNRLKSGILAYKNDGMTLEDASQFFEIPVEILERNVKKIQMKNK